MLIHHNSSMSINVCNIPSQSGGCEDHRPSARHVNFVSPFNSKPSKQLKAATPMNCVLVMFISPFLGVETGGHSLAVITTNSKDTGLLDYCRLPKQDGINTIYRHYSLNIVYAKTNILWGSHARTHARMHARTLPLCIVAIQKKILHYVVIISPAAQLTPAERSGSRPASTGQTCSARLSNHSVSFVTCESHCLAKRQALDKLGTIDWRGRL